jgi:hypothetical protein
MARGVVVGSAGVEMTARDDLAARLSEHSVAAISFDGICCASPECVEGDLAIEFPDMEAFAAHQADVAFAWFQEQTTEEWGMRYKRDVIPVSEGEDVARREAGAHAFLTPVHRRVTAWEEA